MLNERLTKSLLVVSGTICVVLGFIGMFFPILPTTPFLLLAAMAYARSSERFYHWLLTNRWFGEIIKNYREGKGVSLRLKILTLVLMWLSMGYVILIILTQLWAKIVLVIIGISVTIHLIWIKTYHS